MERVLRTFPDLPTRFIPLIEFDHDNGVISLPLGLKERATLDPNISFNVLFGGFRDGIESDVAEIERICEFVSDSVLPRFARFFQ
jgi:hypothetical protein